MSSPQASTVVGSDDEEPAQVPSQQGTQYDDRKFVKELLEACSNKQKKYNFEDYVVEKGRGLEDVHPKHDKSVTSTGKKSYTASGKDG